MLQTPQPVSQEQAEQAALHEEREHLHRQPGREADPAGPAPTMTTCPTATTLSSLLAINGPAVLGRTVNYTENCIKYLFCIID
jgi:hypothetical protein